jgi:hypothetical protein
LVIDSRNSRMFQRWRMMKGQQSQRSTPIVVICCCQNRTPELNSPGVQITDLSVQQLDWWCSCFLNLFIWCFQIVCMCFHPKNIRSPLPNMSRRQVARLEHNASGKTKYVESPKRTPRSYIIFKTGGITGFIKDGNGQSPK